MPSKGIDVYSYIAVPGVTVEFTAPKVTITKNADNNFGSDHLEVDSANIPGHWNFDGKFQFRVLQDGIEIASRFNIVNAATGGLNDGNMLKLSATQSLIQNGLIINYGFYDAGPGRAGLTNAHQCYVTVIPNNSGWMGAVAPPGSSEESKPFTRFVLPSPHDAAMNNLDSFNALLNGPNADNVLKSIFEKLSPTLGDVKLVQEIAGTLSVKLAPDIVLGLAITQKDSITTVLNIGARYFEFRPAYMENTIRQASPFPDELFFQHACIPGMMFEQFLDEIVTFLDNNPTELVAFRITWDGVLAGCEKPSRADIDGLVQAAVSKSRTGIRSGDQGCFIGTIGGLRGINQRLIYFFNDISKYDSYDDQNYATLEPDTIVNRFGTMNADGQNGSTYTVLQCQATATNIKPVLEYSIISSNASTSCLLETKARLDKGTLPWIRDHALDRLTAEKNIVMMNDFFDGATADVAIGLSRRRFAS